MRAIFILGLCLIALICNAQQRPNIIVILADDLGYSDIGCYGSEIKTPHLDQLAAKGVKFTQFYNAARCCPSRASLLTGMYPHQAGMGEMIVQKIQNRNAENPYQGWLSKKTITIAEALKSAGYQTYMSGKWHVGEERPDWPLQRGFDKYFGLISGANSYYELLPGRLMLEDNEPYKIPEDFYMTDAISQKAVSYIDQNKSSGQPFFMYVAYTAPHWPLHALAEDIAKYRGKYLVGWDQLRKERFAKQQKIGLLPKNATLSAREADIPAWEDAKNKEEWDLRMATYAAMVTRMDAGIGKIVAKLKANGQFENTMIVFLADNGACAEVIDGRAKKDLGDEAYTASLSKSTGEKGTYKAYSKEWAALGNTPFRLYKQYTHEGGIATPMIVHYPKIIKKALQTSQVGHIMDIMPTCLALANVTHPNIFNDLPIKPLEGRSLVPIMAGKTRTSHEVLGWEHFGCRAIRQGDWKLVWANTVGKWELYDLKKDRSELNDLSAKLPSKVTEMTLLYDQWAAKVGVENRTKKK
jgi:arylsulfatase A-like enzyme